MRGRAPDHAAEPPRPLESEDQPAHRREVIEALAGRYGAATRLWTQQDRVYLFSALPMDPTGALPPARFARGRRGPHPRLASLDPTRGSAPRPASLGGVVYVTRALWLELPAART